MAPTVPSCAKRKSAASEAIYRSEEPRSKAVKIDHTVEDKLAVVGAAVGDAHGLFVSCQMMLESMVPGALGPAMDERDELQDEGVEMIGKVIGRLLEDRESDVQRTIAIRSDPDGTKVTMQGELADAQAAVEAKVEDEAVRGAGLKTARAELAAAQEELAAARSAVRKAESNLVALQDERKKYEDAYNIHFIPLRDGRFTTAVEAKQHVQALAPVFERFNYEASLIAGFSPAATLFLADREHWDNFTIENAEKGFTEARSRLDDAVAVQTPLISEAVAAAAAAENEVKACLQKEYDAGLALGRARFALALARLKLADAKKALQNFPQTPKLAEAEEGAAIAALKAFKDGPYEAYVYLRDRVAALAPYL
eukprot:CAMPEP_0117495058 /NCGR_PEP_ID=MMETSP0784-20121206/19936_1 /TAXON_ID=39447 /ORGANISM="" /LENGTH=367 /DNA_ID=CAMNT_0005289967 /DNA_START=83 /DNA_END=1186 /DNA_ORIENTATION=+